MPGTIVGVSAEMTATLVVLAAGEAVLQAHALSDMAQGPEA